MPKVIFHTANRELLQMMLPLLYMHRCISHGLILSSSYPLPSSCGVLISLTVTMALQSSSAMRCQACVHPVFAVGIHPAPCEGSTPHQAQRQGDICSGHLSWECGFHNPGDSALCPNQALVSTVCLYESREKGARN